MVAALHDDIGADRRRRPHLVSHLNAEVEFDSLCLCVAAPVAVCIIDNFCRSEIFSPLCGQTAGLTQEVWGGHVILLPI